MDMTRTEKILLEKVSQFQLITKGELLQFLEQQNISNPHAVLDSTIQTLKGKGYINIINPIGSTCLVITQEGLRALDGR